MKLETFVVIVKLFCVFAGTGLLTLQTGLGILSQSDKSLTTIQWVMVVGGSLGTGLTAAGAFLSSAFGNYMNNAQARRNFPPPENLKPLLTPIKKSDTVVPQ